jgi:hypothetical protein
MDPPPVAFRLMAHHVDRPLRLSEIFAETIRLYGERIAAALALGALFTGALLVGVVLHPIAWFALATVAFGGIFAAACRLAAGDSFAEAWAQVVLRMPLLLPLFFAVVLPFVVTLYYGILVLVGAAWLALGGFAIPVAMLESPPERASVFVRMGFAFDRAIQLARVHYLHALGVIAALLVVELLVSQLLIGLLFSFADNTAVAAAFLAGIVLWPFVFFGLAVLYFEQRTRVKTGAAQTSAG